MLDLEFVRNQFPAFSEPSLQGQAHFENAGGSYACRQVIDRLCHYYRCTKVQPYYDFAASQQAGQAMDQAYQRLAEYLNVDPDEVHLGPSTSQNTVTLAQAVQSLLQPGDEIIVTNQDHEANSGVWRKLAQHGLVVREWPVDPDSGELNPADLERLITDKTRLLAFPHCSNLVAHINPVSIICAQARAAGVMTVVDGVSWAGHGLPDVSALGADIYLFSLYKTYGPHQGVMVVRRAMAEQLGHQAHYFLAGAPHKQFNTAGPDHAQVAAATGVAEDCDAVHQHHFGTENTGDVLTRARQVRELLHAAEQPLLQSLLDYLGQRQDLRLLGPADVRQRAATVSLISRRHTARELGRALAARGIMAGAGHFYAYRLLEALGEDPQQGALRLSFVHYTHPQDMQQLLQALDEVLG
ncbi:MAG: aminotransferase class V-fold PLP-dependent enzyme [Thiolinea sp.]